MNEPKSQVLVATDEPPTSPVLREAGRRAALPSLAGIAYEAMGLAWVFGAIAALTLLGFAVDDTEVVSSAIGSGLTIPKGPGAIAFFVLAAPLILVATRIAAGLARMAAPGAPEGRRQTAYRAWRSGRAVQTSAFGIWMQVFGMMASGTLCLVGPLVLLSIVVGPEALGPFNVILSGLALTLTLVYGAELGALQELAMASVVRHQRGVGSAVLHAWRMMKAMPGASRKMAAAEFATRFTIVAASIAVGRAAGPGWGAVQFAVLGALFGGIRCHAWSLAYPRIGGLEPQTLPEAEARAGTQVAGESGAPRESGPAAS